MTMDNETAIWDSIASAFPNLSLLLCWNHLLQDMKRWLKDHGNASSESLCTYLQQNKLLIIHFQTLLHLLVHTDLDQDSFTSNHLHQHYFHLRHPVSPRAGLFQLPLSLMLSQFPFLKLFQNNKKNC